MGEWGGGKLIMGSCGIDVEDLETAARCPGESQRVLYLWSMGMNQFSEGTAKVRSLIDLHLVTGQVKKPAGLFSLTQEAKRNPNFSRTGIESDCCTVKSRILFLKDDIMSER